MKIFLAKLFTGINATFMNSKEIKSAFEYLQMNEDRLNPGQNSFVGSLRKQFVRSKRLSEKQQFILYEIKKYVYEK